MIVDIMRPIRGGGGEHNIILSKKTNDRVKNSWCILNKQSNNSDALKEIEIKKK